MPTERLRAKKKAGRAAVERQAPEPMNRMVHRDRVVTRVTRSGLRRLIDSEAVR